MRGKGFATQWVYLPIKQVRVPSWLEAEVKQFCHQREIDRLRSEIRETRAEIAEHRQKSMPLTASMKKKQEQARAKRERLRAGKTR